MTRADAVATSLYVTSQIAIAVPLGLSAFLTFVVLRTKWSGFYMALGRSRGMFPKGVFEGRVDISIGNKLPTLSRGLFSWIPQLYNITDDQVLEAAGLDAYVVRHHPWNWTDLISSSASSRWR